MNRATLILLALAAVPVAAPASADAQSQQAQIEQAVLAAPPAMRADATVIQLRDDGTSVVLREGSNGLMCWDSSAQEGVRWSAQCTSVGNRERVEQNHAFNSAGGSEEEIQARFDEAERNGTRALSEFGSFYFHVVGDSPETVRPHTTIAVPNATSESLGGIPTQRRPAALWLMQPGTTSAHLMLPM